MITSQQVEVTHLGTGNVTVFAFPFYAIEAAALQVYRGGVLLSQSGNYTVQGLRQNAGGTITFAVAPGAGVAVRIVRDTPRIQGQTYDYQTDFPAKVTELALDRAICIAQEERASLQKMGGDISGLSEEVDRLASITLSGLRYMGNRTGSAVPAAAGKAGDFYYITQAGSSQGIAWAIGDVAVWMGGGEWGRIPGALITIPDATPTVSGKVQIGGSGVSAEPVKVYRPSALSRWLARRDAKIRAGQTVSILCGIDSLTAGSGGFNYIKPFRYMVQDALGDGGIGFQPPTIEWEFGNNGMNYSGFSAQTVDPATDDDRRMGLNIRSLYKAAAGGSITFNAGQQGVINRETDEADIYFLKTPTGATSSRMYAYPGGPITNGISHQADPAEIGKQTIVGFGKSSGWLGTNVALDSQNGPVRYLGVNYRRNCPGGGAQVHYWAQGGTTLRQWASLNAASLQYLASELALDLVIINGGMNDRNSRTRAEFKADLEKLLTSFRAGSDCAILLFFPTLPTTNAGNLALYREAMLELADQYDCAFVDTAWMLGTNSDAYANGLIMADRVHPTERGTRIIADYIFNIIGGSSNYQLLNTPYNAWAPYRNYDVRSVAGWVPGTLFTGNQDFNGTVRAVRFDPYYPNNSVRSRATLTDKRIPNTNDGTPFKLYDLGIINGNPEVVVRLTIYLNRIGTSSSVGQEVYVSLSNGATSQRALGSVFSNPILLFRNAAGDGANIDLSVTVTNNSGTGRAEIYVTPVSTVAAAFTGTCIAEAYLVRGAQAGQMIWEF
ncbi:lysophospholipase L1-like esterase [Opitutaceae bacterium TAV1]|nr:lysophospholipase L1-like esterase [Opitutaceae bacterium TAV1]